MDSVKQHDVTLESDLQGQEDLSAVTLAVTALKRGQVKRIILTRPAVEAGESRFLPGDPKEKVDLIFDRFMMPCIDSWERPNDPSHGA